MKQYAYAALVSCILLAPACSKKTSEPRPVHVVVVSIDTLRADALRAYNPSARPHPNLDRLAAKGHTFEHAYSTAAWTLPAHASLFTGLYPDRHRVVDPRFAIGDIPTLAETLRKAGYETVGFSDGGYVGAQYGFGRGFEVYDDTRGGQNSVPSSRLPRGGKRPLDTKAHIFDRAKAFLEHREDPRPLMLFAHTYGVHDYFRSWETTEPGSKPKPSAQSGHDLQCLLGHAECSAQRWAELEDAYHTGIDAADRELGVLLDLVDDRLGLDRTVVVVVSDHGEGFDHERDRIHHGGRLHRDQLAVPLLVAGPGIARARSLGPVSLVDVFPTLVELLGIDGVPNLDGHSRVARLKQQKVPPDEDTAWASEYHHYWEDGKRKSVRKPKDHPGPIATARIDPEHWRIEEGTATEVYASSDSGQTKPLDPGAHGAVTPRRKALEVTPEMVQETVEVRDQLRALGYVQ